MQLGLKLFLETDLERTHSTLSSCMATFSQLTPLASCNILHCWPSSFPVAVVTNHQTLGSHTPSGGEASWPLPAASIVTWPSAPCGSLYLLFCLLKGHSSLDFRPILIQDDLILRSSPQLHLQRPFYQIRSHSEVPSGDGTIHPIAPNMLAAAAGASCSHTDDPEDRKQEETSQGTALDALQAVYPHLLSWDGEMARGKGLPNSQETANSLAK